jgi:hypothetical protein
LKPESRVATTHLQDELNSFTRDFLFNPINRNGNLRYSPVIAMNATDGDRWRSNFASVVNEVWSRGGDMWVSKRLITERPRPEWAWVEGDDPRISWNDLYKFFSQFEFNQSAGGEDGFLLLEPTERNSHILKSIPSGQ